MPAVAATNPPVLIAMVAAATERIRVGSGGVMLPNHAPLVVAEQFALLEAAHPGRIDLGLGRAPGTDPVTAWALRHGGGGVEADAADHFPTYVDNIITMMSPGGAGLDVNGTAARAERDPARGRHPDRLAARVLGLLGPAGRPEGAAVRLRPPLLGPGHGRVAGAVPRTATCPPRRTPSRARSSPSTPWSPRPRRRRTASSCRTSSRWSRCGPAPRSPPRRWSRRRSRVAWPRSTRAWRSSMLDRWIVGTPDGGGQAGARARDDVRRRRGDAAPRRRRARPARPRTVRRPARTPCGCLPRRSAEPQP